MLARTLQLPYSLVAPAAASAQVSGLLARGMSSATDTSVTEKIREKVGEMVEKVGEAFKEDGKVGHQFTPEGSAGGTAQEVGGPLDKEGPVGKQFTTKGAVGGKVERAAEALDEKGSEMQKKAAEKAPRP